VFVEDQTIEDIVKTKVQVPEQVSVHVSPKKQQQDISDSNLVPAASAQQQAEKDDAEDVQDDAHGGACDEDAPEQHEYDAEEDDHDQEAPTPDSPPAAPLKRFLLPGTHQISMWCYYLMVQNPSAFKMQ